MNGMEWMEALQRCPKAKENLPLQLRFALPLPDRRGKGTVECWYYRLPCTPRGPQLYSPERYVLWDAATMDILQMERMEPVLLGTALDMLDPALGRLEKAYLEGPLTEALNGTSPNSDELTAAWLEAQPQVLRPWLTKWLEGDHES